MLFPVVKDFFKSKVERVIKTRLKIFISPIDLHVPVKPFHLLTHPVKIIKIEIYIHGLKKLLKLLVIAVRKISNNNETPLLPPSYIEEGGRMAL